MRLNSERSLEICFMGGSQAGIIGALTVLSKGHNIIAAVSYFDGLTQLLKLLDIPFYASIYDKNFLRILSKSDILVSVHGREIVKPDQLAAPRMGCINAHPYLYKYKGAGGIEKALEDRNFNGSVGVHRMTSKIDEGEVLVEEFVDVTGANTVEEVYNRLYPCYGIALAKALDILVK